MLQDSVDNTSNQTCEPDAHKLAQGQRPESLFTSKRAGTERSHPLRPSKPRIHTTRRTSNLPEQREQKEPDESTAAAQRTASKGSDGPDLRESERAGTQGGWRRSPWLPVGGG